MTNATIHVPKGFSLRATVRSHGWSDLPPFDTDGAGDALTVHLPEAKATVTERGGTLRARLESRRPLTPPARRRAIGALKECLRLDLDLDPFWTLCRKDPDLAWAPRLRAGRFLRAPTAFADAAMILATTNCSWALTRTIVRSLADRYGENGALPSQDRIARVSEAELRRTCSLGYRAPYLAALARGPDLEAFRTDASPTEDLRRKLLALPGFGPYAADNMLRLLGHFDYLALDSWVVKRWRELHPRRKPTESAINRHLARYGRWKGLALWLLCTAKWYRREAWRDKF
mgnify:CR=1 FL=1